MGTGRGWDRALLAGVREYFGHQDCSQPVGQVPPAVTHLLSFSLSGTGEGSRALPLSIYTNDLCLCPSVLVQMNSQVPTVPTCCF